MTEVTTNPTAEKKEAGLDYISKSRLKTYKTCPRKFYLKYWCENRPPSTPATDRGSDIHEMFEEYHENIIEYVDLVGEHPDDWWRFLPEWSTLQFLEPYVGNFWKFEARRRTASSSLEQYLPVSVEEEAWLRDPPAGDLPWMGSADVVVQANTLPSFDGDGVVILDYKTGDVPDEKYRDEGIHLEQEFYAMLFEDKYDVEGIAAYYPRHDRLLEAELSEGRRELVKETVVEMQDAPDKGNFPTEEQPLCSYGHGSCFFHKHGDSEGSPCSSSWGCRGGSGPTYEKNETIENGRYG